MEVDPETYAVGAAVSQREHAGTWLGVLECAGAIAATGATAVVLPCPMLRQEGLGVQVCHHSRVLSHDLLTYPPHH